MPQRRKLTFQLLSLVIGLLVLAACASSNPIDTTNLITFKHRTGVFSLQVPKAWTQTQDEVQTESLAAFADPKDQAELIAYTGLLDHRLTPEEGQQVVASLVKNLLNAPGDLRITDQQQQSDGALTAVLSFTRGNEKRSGTAIFHDDQLVLAGVILSGPETGWADFQKAMQPALDSFDVKPDFVQGTYFAPLEGGLYALAVPADWPSQPGANFKKVRSPDGHLQIVMTQKTEAQSLGTDQLAEAGRQLVQESLGKGTLTATERLPDGRVKVHIDRGADSTIGYLDQKDGAVIGLFFDVPADRAADYQPFIDFVYSTYITGKP